MRLTKTTTVYNFGETKIVANEIFLYIQSLSRILDTNVIKLAKKRAKL